MQAEREVSRSKAAPRRTDRPGIYFDVQRRFDALLQHVVKIFVTYRWLTRLEGVETPPWMETH